MRIRDFTRAGHWPTLFASFLYFDVSFMTWVLIGALGVYIAGEFSLNATEKGLMVAIPILSGAVWRVVLGGAVDRFGPKRVAVFGLVTTFVPLFWGWTAAHSFSDVLAIGALLGVAGASFAAALPLASRWYPPEHQGLVMGIAAAGNSGTVIASYFAPRLAEAVGWRGVFGLALVPIGVTLALFTLLARENLSRTSARRSGGYAALLGQSDLWWFSLLYMVSFGGFVGMASFLPIFFFDQYGTSRVVAGNLTALSVFAGSFSRPLGGYLADRIGGIRLLMFLYGAIGCLMFTICELPALAVVVGILFLAMCGLGIGNGAVFQLVPQRFSRDLGTVTGIIGAAGGLGGFLLPTLLGALKDWSKTYTTGFLLFAGASLGATVLLRAVEHGWRRTWVPKELEVTF